MIVEILAAGGATAMFAVIMRFWLISGSYQQETVQSSSFQEHLERMARLEVKVLNAIDDLTKDLKILTKGELTTRDVDDSHAMEEMSKLSEREALYGININRLIVPNKLLTDEINKGLERDIERLLEKNEYWAAHDLIAKARMRNPENISLYLLDAEAYSRENKVDELDLYLNLAEQLAGEKLTDHMLYLKSRAADMRREGNLAIGFCEHLVKEFKDNPRYLTLYGFYQWKYKADLPEAIKWQELAQKNAHNNQAFILRGLNNLAYYHASLGTEDKAESSAIEAAENYVREMRNISTWDQLTSVLDTIGYVLYRKHTIQPIDQKELIQAYMYLVEANRKESNNPLILRHLTEVAGFLGLPGPIIG